MKSITLKPCPFCGEAPTIRNGKWGDNELVIICCEIRGTRYCKYEELH